METVGSTTQNVGGSVALTWLDIEEAAVALAKRNPKARRVWGVPTGGSVVAPFVAHHLNAQVARLVDGADLIVDDLVDSGTTLAPYLDRHKEVDALFRKPHSPATIAPNAIVLSSWLHFPWEKEAHPEDAVIRLLEFIGENPLRNGLKDTPGRVCRALKEMTAGYRMSAEQILTRTFEEAYDEVVILKGVPFASLCEHHMLPFVGTVDIGYLPGKVVGLSKLARLVDCFAQRLQIQERMTREIADAIQTHLQARGVAVVVRAGHSCMSCRGVRKSETEMITSAMLGVFRDKPEARAEFLGLSK